MAGSQENIRQGQVQQPINEDTDDFYDYSDSPLTPEEQGELNDQESDESQNQYEDFPQPQENQTDEETENDLEDTDDKESLEEVDNPRSYRFFQSKYGKERDARIRAETERDLMRKQMEQGRTSERQADQNPDERQKDEFELPPIPELKPKPENYDDVDAITDPESESAKWLKHFNDVQYVLAERARMREVMEDKRINEQKEQQYLAQQKAQMVSAFKQQGIDDQNAIRYMEKFNDPNTWTPQNIVRVLQYLEGQPSQTKSNNRSNQIAKRGQRQDTVLPAGVAPEQNEPKANPFDSMLDEFGQNDTDRLFDYK